jgi:hypothetical protein
MFQKYKILIGGSSLKGAANVGCALAGAVTWTGAVEVLTPDGQPTGVFGATLTFNDGYTGPLLWCTNTTDYSIAKFTGEDINPGISENMDVKVSTRAAQATADAIAAQQTVDGVKLGPNAFDLLYFDGLAFAEGWKEVVAACCGTIRFDPATRAGTVSSPTNPNVIKQSFTTDDGFTTRVNVALTPNA